MTVDAAIAQLAVSKPRRRLEQTAAPTQSADFIVIGAGLAGAAAARHVADKAGVKSVIVLEARMRIGGRTWTQELAGPRGVRVKAELGAAWVHGVTNNPSARLAAKAGVSLASRLTDYDNSLLYFADGKEASGAQEARWEDLFEEFEDFVAAQQDARDGEAPDPGLGVLARRFAASKRLSGLDAQAFSFLTNTNIEHEYGGSLNNMSLYFDYGAEQAGGDKFVTGGYQRLAEWLLRGLDVRLGHQVTAIDSSSADRITVTTAGNGTFTARQVVVAVPLGVLQRGAIRFLPAGLPAVNRKALSQLGMGLLNKVIMVFDRVWWDGGLEVINRLSPKGDGAWQEFFSLASTTGQPMLVAFNAADYAAQLEKKSDAQVKDECLAVLRGMYGQRAVPEPLSYVVTAWGRDAFSCGSYSYDKAPLAGGAARTKARTNSALPMAGKRIFFAGEHTRADFPATTHGALLSGTRAATDLLKNRRN